MELSLKAIADLKQALVESFGNAFLDQLNESELQEIGAATLTLVSEIIKHKATISHSALSTVAVDSAESVMAL